MGDQARAQLQRYVRVAYDGASASEPRAQRRRTRWAAPTGAAVRIAAVLLVLTVAALTVLVISRMPPAAPAPAAPTAMPAPPTTSATATPTDSGGSPAADRLVVHVAGAVASPGVVELTSGARVSDAIEAAGGASREADLDALNLAAPVEDGQQVYVPVAGEAPPAVADGADGAGQASTVVDLNTADATTLQSLPGIGPALAERIIAWRDEHGQFDTVEDLMNVSGIGPATMDELRDLVQV